jgi:hypothetical protein
MGKIQQIYPEEHELRLPENAILWRYVPLKTLFFYLNGNAFIPSLAKLQQGDPFEGKYLFETNDFEAALEARCGTQFANVQKWIRSTLWTPADKSQLDQNKESPDLSANTDENRFFDFLRKTRYRTRWCSRLASRGRSGFTSSVARSMYASA